MTANIAFRYQTTHIIVVRIGENWVGSSKNDEVSCSIEGRKRLLSGTSILVDRGSHYESLVYLRSRL